MAEPTSSAEDTLPLTHRTATDLLPLLASGAVSSVALLEAFLARVEAVNPAVNAVVCRRRYCPSRLSSSQPSTSNDLVVLRRITG
jgi:Asp-tRNA(Asn)/Glu-tRNA(Gln) amidotransferase A subunit family amidase